MQKKKFDLTSDIVEVSLEEKENNQLQNIETPKSLKSNNSNVLLTISIDKKKRNEFKSWCAKRELKMNEAFLKGFELLKKQSDI